MKWLTIEYIREHSRIDFDCEDGLLEQYGTSAENTVLALIRRTYDSLIDEYGAIPAELYESTQMLVTVSYEHRSPVSVQNLSAVPYALELKLKPLMRLSGGGDMEAERDLLLEKLADTQSDFEMCVSELDPDTIDEETQADIDGIREAIDEVQTVYAAVSRVTPLVCRKLRQRVSDITAKCKTYTEEGGEA